MVAKNENMDSLIARYGSPDVQSNPSVSAEKKEYCFDTYGIPDFRVRELIVKKSLFDAAKLLLEHGDSMLILSRNRDGSPSVLEYDGAGHLINFLDFEYED